MAVAVAFLEYTLKSRRKVLFINEEARTEGVPKVARLDLAKTRPCHSVSEAEQFLASLLSKP